MSNEEKESLDSLIAAIAMAFDGVSREGGISLHETGVIDNYGSDEERVNARLLDTESQWQDLQEDDRFRLMNNYMFLDPIGFRYYLPAFLIFNLKYFRDNILWNHDAMIFAFSERCPDADGKVSLLNPVQRKVIARFLEHFVLFDPDGDFAYTDLARQGLSNGWERFLT